MVSVPRWLHLGMSIKRWLAILLIGITLLSLGAGYFLHALYSAGIRFPSWAYYLTLQFLGREVRGDVERTVVARALMNFGAEIVQQAFALQPLEEPSRSGVRDELGQERVRLAREVGPRRGDRKFDQ